MPMWLNHLEGPDGLTLAKVFLKLVLATFVLYVMLYWCPSKTRLVGEMDNAWAF